MKIPESLLQKKLKFELRPEASNGLWVSFLLPTTIILSMINHWDRTPIKYKTLSLFSLGLVLTTILIINGFKKGCYVKWWELKIFLPVSLLYYLFFNLELEVAVLGGFCCTILYWKMYLVLLRKLPRTFTLGEGALAAQALVIQLFTVSTYFLQYSSGNVIVKTFQSSTAIIQMELLGILILVAFLYFFRIKRFLVYVFTVVILVTTFLLPLHVLLGRSPILWVLSLLIKNSGRIKMILYWLFCSALAGVAVSVQKSSEPNNVSTAFRKIFHVLAVAVYIPGLIYECNLLYLGSGILLGIFFLLEIFRNTDVPVLGKLLNESFDSLKDEKDAGLLAVTPIYLLTGFTLPLWIHPAPCDVSDSSCLNLLPLLSGILSVGIGDTAASIVGSEYGKHFYAGSKKTIEGTIACIISQFFTVFILYKLGFIVYMSKLTIARVIIAIVFTSLVEAKTDQIDNAILPLIMFAILI